MGADGGPARPTPGTGPPRGRRWPAPPPPPRPIGPLRPAGGQRGHRWTGPLVPMARAASRFAEGQVPRSAPDGGPARPALGTGSLLPDGPRRLQRLGRLARAPPGGGPERPRLGPGPLVPDGPRRLQGLAEGQGSRQIGGQRGQPPDRVHSSPMARAASRASRRAGPLRLPDAGASAASARTGTAPPRWPAPPPAPRGAGAVRWGASVASARTGGPAPSEGPRRIHRLAEQRHGHTRGQPARAADRNPSSPMARAASSASAGWPSSARRGASAASAGDRDPSSPIARAASALRGAVRSVGGGPARPAPGTGPSRLRSPAPPPAPREGLVPLGRARRGAGAAAPRYAVRVLGSVGRRPTLEDQAICLFRLARPAAREEYLPAKLHREVTIRA